MTRGRREIPFVKMHGAANDFVVIDHRTRIFEGDTRPVFASLCDRRRGVGADGVLLLESADGFDFVMRYFNSDGGAADWCGNGARCLVRFALDLGLGSGGRVRFLTAVGVQEGGLDPHGHGIEVRFGGVTRGRTVTARTSSRSFEGLHVVTGVPHFVTDAGDPASVPIDAWAPALRHHPDFAPEGVNVDFVHETGGGVRLRTWERGVEGETLACGSGAMAAALWAAGRGAASPVRVATAGGDDLWVSFTGTPDGYDVRLSGPAERAFTGVWSAVA